MGDLQNKAYQVILSDLGKDGSKEITGTSAVTPPTGYYFYKIVPSSATVVAAYVDEQTNAADLTAITSHPVGVPIYGRITSITLTSGDAIGYLAKE